jgi:hypothetical protein
LSKYEKLRSLHSFIEIMSREECSRGPGSPPPVQGPICYTVGGRARVCGQSLGTWLSISLRRYATVSQAEIFILTCGYEIEMLYQRNT